MSATNIEPVWQLVDLDEAAAGLLCEELEISPLVARLLVNRSITGLRHAREFLSPKLSRIPDPSTMAGMGAAIDRVVDALLAEQRICVWGDYDVDGVTSASQLLAFFEAIGRPAEYFVPDRFADGYGLSGKRVAELVSSGVDLIITVDCGISNVEEVAIAVDGGAEVIIIDHHKVPAILPQATAILDPHQPGCRFPDKGLAACGVVWMFLIALRRRLRTDGWFKETPEPDLRTWLDLTAIGTVADMVPLVGVNRIIVQQGLHRIARTERPGVKALCEVSGIDPVEVTAGRIGFHLGPRINAAGRIAHASAGVELLTTADESKATATAEMVDKHNRERRGIQETIFEAACELADTHPDPDARRSIVLASHGWHPGVLGIVASKLVERHHRPTILLAIEDGLAKGSARSIRGFKLVDHLRDLEHLLVKYGGHDHAAGLTIEVANLDAFTRGLEEHARAALLPRHLQPRLRIDAEHPLEQVDYDLVEELRALAPYGMGNPEPSLIARGVEVYEARRVGKDKTHLKLTLAAGGWAIDAIAFGMASKMPYPGSMVDVVYLPEINVYKGRERLQIRIKAMRPSDGSPIATAAPSTAR